MKKKNIVLDYVTQSQACEIIGISKKSTPLINRWINQGKIQGAYKFSNNMAIPVSWVKSECNERSIHWEGIKLNDGEVGVSLKDYEPIIDYAKRNDLNYGTFHSTFRRGTFEGDWIKFGNSYGIRK